MAESICRYEKLYEDEEDSNENAETDTNAIYANTSIRSRPEDGNTKRNIALVGETESGKSSFINAILGFEEDDENAAGIGFEKSNKVEPYRFPDSNITLWDHPGLDTLSTNPKDYFARYYDEKFDGYLLFIKGKYTITDKNLAEELCLINKPFLLVRTFIDNNITRRIKCSAKVKEIRERIRENVQELLKSLYDGDVPDSEKKIFLISNMDPDNPEWDFRRLTNAIVTEFKQSSASTNTSKTEDLAEDENREKQILSGPMNLSESWRNLPLVPFSGPVSSSSDTSEEGFPALKKKIGLVGETGSGKSSFISASLRLAAKIAKPGTPTQEPVGYTHPTEQNVEFWDLPGLGTARYPDPQSYYDQLGLADKYDAFLLFTKTKDSTDCKRLAKRLECTGKPFLLIKTFIDEDVDNEKAMKKENFDEETMKEKIRNNLLEGLKIKKDAIYLISNEKPFDWDFLRLKKELPSRLPTLPFGPFFFMYEDANTAKTRMNLGIALQALIEKWEDNKLNKETCLKYDNERNQVKKAGLEASIEMMNERLEKYKKIKVELAVVGRAGVGKSSFINAIRGIEHGSPSAARVGVVDETMKVESYPYKDNKNITISDCPGFGTPEYADNVHDYCGKIGFNTFSGFIIIDCDRFTNESKEMAQKLLEHEKPFFFVRAKIDQDIRNQKKFVQKSNFNEVNMLAKIRNNCIKNLGKVIKESDIYLISNQFPHKWDFPRLNMAIRDKLPSRERECFLFSMANLSKEILVEKIATLRGRIYYVHFISRFNRALTWKSYWQKFNNQLILGRIPMFREKLGFPEIDSPKFKEMPTDRQRDAKEKFYDLPKPETEDVLNWLKKFDRGESTRENTPPWLDPESYEFVHSSLNRLLDEMGAMAFGILRDTIAKSQADHMGID
ncbi:uncharacterized protein LOC114526864 isoform X1 [Dendronephthya gigantea]|uniref:uncharacterized protein LOC114526864 isoform X1 n=1 Tax=Dendronephthya gigantea TaxID=151771 RepID=UPI00106CE6EC|nr:uncharacterized protein LOC114526864 isoform X1 [Dendronephthya gigantea]